MNLYTSDNWEVIFGIWSQEFPGYCIISSKKEKLSALTKEEWMELGSLEKELERVCNKVLKPTMYNFTCLMNNAYRDNETPHVHYHFFPRYKEEAIIVGKKYKDKHFGYNFWKWANNRFKSQKDIFTSSEKEEIYNLIKNEFKKENI
jgi:diadenosine tetraphosphate (Ap4A) HIT family hydrolase